MATKQRGAILVDCINRIEATLVKGHQVASGTSKHSLYPAGTIALQKPYFKTLGLDLTACFDGTLNLQLNAKSFSILLADFCFEEVRWIDGFNPETFSFVACQLEFAEKRYAAWIYYPHPETKTHHIQPANLIEILTEKITAITYGDTLTLHYDPSKIQVN